MLKCVKFYSILDSDCLSQEKVNSLSFFLTLSYMLKLVVGLLFIVLDVSLAFSHHTCGFSFPPLKKMVKASCCSLSYCQLIVSFSSSFFLLTSPACKPPHCWLRSDSIKNIKKDASMVFQQKCENNYCDCRLNFFLYLNELF